MPKLLVLFDARSDDLARLADAVADGARAVRFAEVDVRRIAPGASSGGHGAADRDVDRDADRAASPGGRHRALESPEALGAYDGIVVGVAAGRDTGEAVRALLSGSDASLVNKVASAFTSASGDARRDALWSVLTPMADRGMILVPAAFAGTGADDLEAARRQGKRVLDVIGWITHARSHHHHH